MGMTKNQLEKRRTQKGYGSSDVPTILGVNPWVTPKDLWLYKTGKAAQSDIVTKAMRQGILLEPALLDFAEEELGKITRNQKRRVEGLPLIVNIDAILNETGEPIEAKSAQIALPLNVRETWGDPGTDIVPARVLAQSTAHMMGCKNKPLRCHVPAIVSYRGMSMYVVPRNENLISIIGEAVIKFDMLVERDIPPEDNRVSLEVAKALKRIPNKVIELPYDDMVTDYLTACETYKLADQRKKEMYAQVLAKMGDAEVADFGTEKVLTYFGRPNKGYTVAPFIKHELRWVKRASLQLENKTKEIEEKKDE